MMKLPTAPITPSFIKKLVDLIILFLFLILAENFIFVV